MSDTHCVTCGAEFKPEGCTTGYGVYREGRKHCFACCGERDRETMRRGEPIGLYLSKEGGRYRVTNWPGTLNLAPIGVSESKSSGFGGWHKRLDAWFMFEGAIWHIRVQGDMQCGTARRTKRDPRRWGIYPALTPREEEAWARSASCDNATDGKDATG